MRNFLALLAEIHRGVESGALTQAEAAHYASQRLCRIFHCARASIWTIQAGQAMRLGGYDALQSRPLTELAELVRAKLGKHLVALTRPGIFVSEDVMADERLACVRDKYLAPHSVTSVLAAPLRFNGVISGVVCLESVGVLREWQTSEIARLKSFANSMSLRKARAAISHRESRGLSRPGVGGSRLV